MRIRLLILMIVLMAAPVVVSAQFSVQFDIVTVEALIKDHKDIRSKQYVRAAIEEGNAALHSLVNDTIRGYKDMSDLLDKYDHFFNILDLIISGACTVVKVYGSYQVIKDRLSGMRSLLSEYHDNCLRVGNIQSSDTRIIKIGENMIKTIAADIDELVSSLSALLKFQGITSVADLTAMSTKTMIEILEHVNTCIDKVVEVVCKSYLKLWSYVKARMSPFFSPAVFRSRSMMEIGIEALDRWLQNSGVFRAATGY